MVSCIVPLCDSRKGSKKKRKISFHEVPAEFNLRKKWIASIEPLLKEGINGIRSRTRSHSDTVIYRTTETGEESLILGERAVFCSLHFPDSAFKKHPTRRILIRGSVPSIFQNAAPIESDESKQQEIPPTKKINSDKTGKAAHLVILKENVNNQQKTRSSDNEGEKQKIPPTKIDVEKASHLDILKENVNNQQQTYISEDAADTAASDGEHSVGNDSLCVNYSENSICDSPPHSPCKKRETPTCKKRETSTCKKRKTSTCEKREKSTPIKYESAQRKIRRLKARIRKLQAEREHLKAENSSLKDKLIRYNIDSFDDITDVKSSKVIFLRDQLRALGKRKVNWSDSSMKYATELYDEFPSSYQFLREKFLNLPSHSTIKRFLHAEDKKFLDACSDASPKSNFEASPTPNFDASPTPNFDASPTSNFDASPT